MEEKQIQKIIDEKIEEKQKQQIRCYPSGDKLVCDIDGIREEIDQVLTEHTSIYPDELFVYREPNFKCEIFRTFTGDKNLACYKPEELKRIKELFETPAKP